MAWNAAQVMDDGAGSTSYELPKEFTMAVDSCGYLKSFNQAAHDFFGLTPKCGGPGHNIMEVIVPEQRQLAAAWLAQPLKCGTPVQRRLMVQGSDGSRHEALVKSTAQCRAGRPVGLVLSMEIVPA